MTTMEYQTTVSGAATAAGRLLLTTIVPFLLAGGFIACEAQDRHDRRSQLRTIDDAEQDSLDAVTSTIDRSRRNAITRAVESAAPAIVGINVTEVRRVAYRDPLESWFRNDPFFRDYQRMLPRRAPQIYEQEIHGLGSGFLISPDGYIITNDHVAGTATKVIVTTTDGEKHVATIIGTDRATDVTLLKIEGEGFPYLPIGSSEDVIIGEWAIALGNPFGLFDINAKPTVTVGVVSNTDVTLRPQDDRVYLDMIQTDAAISSGNSGGPLVNALGEVIGMNTIIYSTSQNYQGAGSIGIGFAVPIDRVMEVVEELKKYGKIDRDFWTGMNIRSIDAKIARYLRLESTEGAVIVEVAPNSPATKAGLEIGDVIVKIDDRAVRSDEDVILAVNDARVGQKLTLTINRDGEWVETTMTLEPRQR